MKTKLIIIAALTLLFSINLFAQNGGKAEPNRVKFAKGKSSIVLTGTLSNDEQMEYVFGAKAGQKITLKVTSAPKGKFFDFDLAGDGFELETERDYYDDYTFTAPETGDYLVYVRKRPTGNVKTAKFSLSLSIK
ncbi:MAG TPA: hypothetical protein PKY59_08815 [Pyrinomonadaceae bacterium]|nr:hypothetical protein [Pyrinomonadaceae bacterium]